jgi:hypothetical protein
LALDTFVVKKYSRRNDAEGGCLRSSLPSFIIPGWIPFFLVLFYPVTSSMRRERILVTIWHSGEDWTFPEASFEGWEGRWCSENWNDEWVREAKEFLISRFWKVEKILCGRQGSWFKKKRRE